MMLLQLRDLRLFAVVCATAARVQAASPGVIGNPVLSMETEAWLGVLRMGIAHSVAVVSGQPVPLVSCTDPPSTEEALPGVLRTGKNSPSPLVGIWPSAVGSVQPVPLVGCMESLLGGLRVSKSSTPVGASAQHVVFSHPPPFAASTADPLSTESLLGVRMGRGGGRACGDTTHRGGGVCVCVCGCSSGGRC